MDRKLCRLCCKNEATSFIFLEDSDNIQLCAKIMYCCAKVIIEDGDGLPSFICDVCERDLNACYQFVLKCEESDKQLRSQSLELVSDVEKNDCKNLVEVKTEIKSPSDYETPFADLHSEPYEDLHSDDIPLEQLRQDTETTPFADLHSEPYEDLHSEPYDDLHSDDIPLEQLQQDTKTIEVEKPKNKIHKRKSYKSRTKFRNRRTEQGTKCTVCGRQCINPSTLVIHMRSHTNEYLFPCSLCDKKYKDSGNLKRHMNSNHSDHRKRDFICESCGKAFFSKSDVKIHMRTHTGETPYKCTECSAKFTQIGAMLRHKKRHSGEKEHLCSICSKRFSTKQELKTHQVVHSKEKKYECPICNTMFKHQSNLTKHKRRHSESVSFICNYCGRNFKFKGNLKLHIDKQHSEKSGYCESCSRHVPNLEAHMWRHTGERPLKCEICNSSFFELKGLARHVNFKHKNTDKYKCVFEGCSMVFPSRPMLDFHVVKLHGTHIPFPCDRCTRAFYRKNDLARHKIGTHKERLL